MTHGGLVPRPRRRGYDRAMLKFPLQILLCFALFAGADVHAWRRGDATPDPVVDAPSRMTHSRPTSAAPSVPGDRDYNGRTALPPPRLNDRYGRRGEDRFGPGQMEQRYETLRSRYAAPRNQDQGRDLNQAVESARRRHGGKVLSAERMQMDGRDGYRVKLLTPSGRVRIVQMPNSEVSPAPEEQQGER